MRRLRWFGNVDKPGFSKNAETFGVTLSASPAEEAPAPCNNRMGPHEGPLVGRLKYLRFMAENPDDGMDWSGHGECAACGDTITEDQLRKGAA